SIKGLDGKPPVVIEIDALDLDSEPAAAPTATAQTKIAFLQYTSGSTRTPAGVMVTHTNAVSNMLQMASDTFEPTGGTPPSELNIVSWMPFYHDLGLLGTVIYPMVLGRHTIHMSPMAFLAKPSRWMQELARQPIGFTG
ncbi:AMP-binding protein, partial [Mycobacterium stomatepiae]